MSNKYDENVNPESMMPSDEPERASLRHKRSDDVVLQKLVVDIARELSDSHCENIKIFDVRGLTDIFDYVIIATGTSDRQIKSVGDDVEHVAEAVGYERFGKDVDGPTTWLVLDLVDVVVHVFEEETRAHYDIEMMWGDAKLVAWER